MVRLRISGYFLRVLCEAQLVPKKDKGNTERKRKENNWKGQGVSLGVSGHSIKIVYQSVSLGNYVSGI